MIESVKQRIDGSVSGGPFSDGLIYESISSESPLWDEIREWMAAGGVVDPVDPDPVPVTVVYAVDLWTRLDGGEDGNSGEVAQVIAEMEQQPIRIRKIFDSATSYRSDHELWPLLQQIATTLFGEERAAQILAPSSQQ
jgi:hypothetical protein